jgi:hypothetical protein
MARIRSVKPEFWTDEDLADLSRDARLLYIGLWNIADEHGRLRGDPRYVKGQLFPYDDDLSREAVDGLVDELAKVGKVVRYQAKGSSYLFLPTLHKHQRLDTAKVPSRLPAPPSENFPDESGKFPDETETGADESVSEAGRPSAQVSAQSENFPDSSQPGADESALLYVAGSRLQVAGSRDNPSAPPAADETPRSPTFADFYAAYPLKKDRLDAEKAFNKALKKPGVTPEILVAAACSYRDDPTRKPEFTKYPATWLNKGGWTDEPSPPADAPPAASGRHVNPTDPDEYRKGWSKSS